MSDERQGYPGAPPGWYADPAGGPAQRWWDGYAWTEATVLPAQPPPPPLPPTPPVAATGGPGQPGYESGGYGAPPISSAGHQPPGSWNVAPLGTPDLVARERSFTNIGRLALGFFGVDHILGLINVRLQLSKSLVLGHQFRLIYEAAKNGQPAPTFSNTQTIDPLQAILLLAEVGAIIVACMWQFRAASAARALGLPHTHSPGWGVGSWFVPVVNIWMPYQALRDCLPAVDPNRGLILRWWLMVLGAEVLTTAAAIAALFSGGVSFGFSIPAAVLAVGMLATGPRVVSVIESAHSGLLHGPTA
jgi:hypothetical protein